MIRRRVARNTLSNYAATAAVLGVGFVITPLILNLLGPAQYGLWVLVSSVTAYGTLLNMGIGTALVKYVAELNIRGQAAQAQPLIATALWMFIAVGAGILGLTLALALVFPFVFHVEPRDLGSVRLLVIVSGLAVASSVTMGVPVGVLQGLQRFERVNLLSTLNLLLSSLAGLAVLGLGGGVTGFAAAGIPITLAMQALGHALIRRTAPDYAITWHGTKRDLARKILGYSWSMLLLDTTERIKLKSDEVVVGALMPMASVTPYYLARRLAEIPKMLTLQFQKVLMPLASELNASDDPARVKSVFLTGTRLTLAIFCATGVTIACLAQPALTLWVGHIYASSWPIVAVLVCAGFFELCQYPAGAVLQGMARHKPLAIIAVPFAAANVILSVLFIQRMGSIGAAFGTLIPATIETFALVLPFTVRAIGVPARSLVRDAFVPTLLPAIPAAILLIGLQQAVNLATWPLLLGAGCLGVCVYGFVYVCFGATSDERRSYQALAASMVDRMLGRGRRKSGQRTLAEKPITEDG